MNYQHATLTLSKQMQTDIAETNQTFELAWTFKLEGGPNHGLTGYLTSPLPTVRTPEAEYRRDALETTTPTEITYRWVGEGRQ